MDHDQPLVVLRPTRKWIYSTFGGSIITLFLINVSTAIAIIILKDTVFQVNWLKLLDSTRDETLLNFSTRYIANFAILLVILLFLMSWLIIYLILSLVLLLAPVYLIFAIKYIQYEFYPNLLVVNRGIFIKTKKIFPYRSLTMVQHFQTVVERIFGIGTLAIHEPQFGVLLVSGIENNLVLELFAEYYDMLLNDKIRMMEESGSNKIRMKAIVSDNRLKKRGISGILFPALQEMHTLMPQVLQVIKESRKTP